MLEVVHSLDRKSGEYELTINRHKVGVAKRVETGFKYWPEKGSDYTVPPEGSYRTMKSLKEAIIQHVDDHSDRPSILIKIEAIKGGLLFEHLDPKGRYSLSQRWALRAERVQEWVKLAGMIGVSVTPEEVIACYKSDHPNYARAI